MGLSTLKTMRNCVGFFLHLHEGVEIGELEKPINLILPPVFI